MLLDWLRRWSLPRAEEDLPPESAGVDVLLAVDVTALAIEREGGYRSPQVSHRATPGRFRYPPQPGQKSQPRGPPRVPMAYLVHELRRRLRLERQGGVGKIASSSPKSSSFDIVHPHQCILGPDPKDGAAHARVERKKQCDGCLRRRPPGGRAARARRCSRCSGRVGVQRGTCERVLPREGYQEGQNPVHPDQVGVVLRKGIERQARNHHKTDRNTPSIHSRWCR